MTDDAQNTDQPTPAAEPEATAKPAEASAASQKPAQKAEKRPPDRIVIHPFPKIVLLWPVMVVSIVFYFLGGGWWNPSDPVIEHSALGWWWMVLFFFNLMVHTFDFGRTNFIATVATTAVVLLGLWVWDLQSEADIYGSIYKFFSDQQLAMHPNFYASIAGVLAVLMLMAFITTRFNYWVLAPNQLTHKHGILGDERHYSTLHIAVEKEIPDVFEFILFGSGKLIFKPGIGSDQNKVLTVENVFRINKVEKEVRGFLGVIKVDEDRTR